MIVCEHESATLASEESTALHRPPPLRGKLGYGRGVAPDEV